MQKQIHKAHTSNSGMIAPVLHPCFKEGSCQQNYNSYHSLLFNSLIDLQKKIVIDIFYAHIDEADSTI